MGTRKRAAGGGRSVARRSRRGDRSLGDRLAAARQRHFVGRGPELELFRAAIRGREFPFALLQVSGPGGVGKSTLVREYGRLARAAGLTVAAVDGHAVAPSPDDFLAALRRSLGAGEESPFERLAGAALIIDTFEHLAPLDAWLCDSFLPRLPADCLVVIAGRDLPAFRTSSAWSGLVRSISLRNLHPDESRSYLRSRGVPRGRHEAALAFTHGHPLALSLVADVLAQSDPAAPFSPARQPDVVRALLDQFLRNLPGPRHRMAVEATAHVRVMTEDLLARSLGVDDAHDLFEWLRGLSFIEQGPHGLFPHDLVRDLVDGDLRWRSPESYRALHRRARDYIIQRIADRQGLERQRACFDLLDLHRNNPIMRPYYQWRALGSLRGVPAATGDRDAILDMVQRHEGAASARIAAHWLDRQPGAFTVFRGADPEPVGFSAVLCLDQNSAADAGGDPAIEAALATMERRAPLRAGEQFVHGRFTISRDAYQAPSPVFDMTATMSVPVWMTTARLAWAFVALSGVEFWQPMFRYLNFPRCPEADFEVGGRRLGIVGHDFRIEPPMAWLDAMADREIDRELRPEMLETSPPPLLVLSRPEFDEAVRRALRDLASPDALAANPLLRSRLVLDHAAGRPPVEALRELIAAAAARLEARPRDHKFHRALAATYLDPAPTQELAAERLNLPFGTYRYQLAVAIERVTGWLWQGELAGHAPGPGPGWRN